MPIILSLVAQLPSLRVLVEHCDGTYANCTPAILSQTAKVVLGKVNPRTEPRMSYTHENHMLHTLAAEELIFLCVTDLSCKRQVAFAFLEDLSRRFGTVFPHGSRFPEPWKVSVEMNPVIEALMVATNSQSTGSAKAARAKNAIEEVKGQMMDNIGVHRPGTDFVSSWIRTWLEPCFFIHCSELVTCSQLSLSSCRESH